jgi:hypothetical protein
MLSVAFVIVMLNVIMLSVSQLSSIECHYDECQFVTVMLSVVMLNIVRLSVVAIMSFGPALPFLACFVRIEQGLYYKNQSIAYRSKQKARPFVIVGYFYPSLIFSGKN